MYAYSQVFVISHDLLLVATSLLPPDGLKYLQVLRLAGCNHLRDPGLAHLASVRESLRELDISGCGGITQAGLPSLYLLR